MTKNINKIFLQKDAQCHGAMVPRGLGVALNWGPIDPQSWGWGGGCCGGFIIPKLEKKKRITPIRRTAVREADVSRHLLEAPLKPPWYITPHSIVLRGLRRALKWAPITSRDFRIFTR